MYDTPPTSDKNRESAVASRQSLKQNPCVYHGPEFTSSAIDGPIVTGMPTAKTVELSIYKNKLD